MYPLRRKIFRNVIFPTCHRILALHNCPLQQKVLPNFGNIYHNNFHTNNTLLVKMYMEKENKYAYNIMENCGYTTHLDIFPDTTCLSKDEFEHMILKDWTKESHEEIFKAFPLLISYISNNNLCLSDTMFDNFIDALTDNIEHSSVDELKSHFYTLARCPATLSIRTRNYVEIWVALDDACVNRYKQWSYDEILSFVALFYMLSATRASDYCYKSIQRLTFRAHKLTKPQLVQTFFFIAAMRFSPNDMHNLELAVEKCFDKFSIDELAIISMGFFKSKVPVRNFNTISRIIDKILENPSAVHEVSLAALLKVIRLSRKIPIDDKIYDLLEKLQCEVSRLSIMCNVHIALLSCSTLTLHEGCLLKIAEVVLKNITNARIKDFERLVLTFGTFNLLPQTPDNFIEKVIDELRKPYREQEILTHGRSFACCIAHLGLSGYYPLDLIEKTLNKPFLEQTYGKYCLSYGREILSLNNFVKIFHKNANIDLSDKESLTLAKRYTDYLPDENYAKQYNVTEKLYMDIKRVIESDRGANYVVGHHIVTHHQRGDLIICDDVNNRPVAVQDVFSNIKFGTLCSAPNDNNIWIALIVVGRNGMLYKDNKPSGHFLSKIRELNALGFKAAPVCWTYYSECKTHEEKLKYINTVIKEAKSIR